MSEYVWMSSIAAASGSTVVRLLADRGGGREREHRADALAAGQQRVAHRLLEALGLGRRAAEAQRLEVALDVVAQLVRVAGRGRAASAAGAARPSH